MSEDVKKVKKALINFYLQIKQEKVRKNIKYF